VIGIRIVRQGKRVAVWDAQGHVELVDGPRRLVLWRQTVEELRQFAAAADQYLVLRFRDGHAEHLRGPAAVWFDPILHESVKVKQALSINAHEAVVVYRRAGEEVSRRVVRGPALFVPTEDEWLHEFRWHGADPRDLTRKIPNGLQFTKLWVIPDQTYFDVRDVRTADDALVVIKVMIFFELLNIEQMLDQTHDPVADFINALSADVIEFVAGRHFEAFKGQTERLNELETYPNLCGRAERIGYRINKVVYRGYTAGDKLQGMHDDAIETRTQLKLAAETEVQSQELADLKLQREAQRAVQQRQMQQEQAEHERRIRQLAHEEHIRQADAEARQRAEAERLLNQVRLDDLRSRHQERAGFLREMQALQVDLTKYLVAQYRNPDRMIRIDGERRPQLHLHEP